MLRGCLRNEWFTLVLDVGQASAVLQMMLKSNVFFYVEPYFLYILFFSLFRIATKKTYCCFHWEKLRHLSADEAVPFSFKHFTSTPSLKTSVYRRASIQESFKVTQTKFLWYSGPVSTAHKEQEGTAPFTAQPLIVC